jgi:hypothetical protein
MLSLVLLNEFKNLNHAALTRHQAALFEADLFTVICDEVKEYFRLQRLDYFRLTKTTNEQENEVMEKSLAMCVVNDILASEEYTALGIACYAHTSEDVVYDIASGLNCDPSSTIFRNIIKLHRSIRPQLYNDILRKITVTQ